MTARGTGEVRKKQAAGQDVLTLGRARVAHIFDLFDHVAVAFSGGKDSTVCLHLCLEEAQRRGRLPLDVVHYDEEAIPYQTEQYVRRVAAMPGVALRWYCLPVTHANACSPSSPWWYPWDPDLGPDRWCRPLPPEAVTELAGWVPKSCGIPEMNRWVWPASQYGRVACVMGIRAAESITRYRAVARKGKRRGAGENYLIPDTPTPTGHIVKAYPIYDWSTRDVWTAPARLGWDYNRAYDALEMAGLTHHAQRCAPPYGTEPMRGLWTFKTCFPEVWDRMATRVPGAATAARYANTVLYAAGEVPDKPADLTWQEWVVSLLERHAPDVRGELASRFRKLIQAHYRKTADPILPVVPHPVTGMCWQWVAKIALRGDPKSRKWPDHSVHNTEAEWVAYRAARAVADEEAKALK